MAAFSGVRLIPKGEAPVLTQYYENAPKIVPNYSRKGGDFSCTLVSERFTGHIIERRAESYIVVTVVEVASYLANSHAPLPHKRTLITESVVWSAIRLFSPTSLIAV